MSLWLGPRERKGGVQRGMRVRHHEAAPIRTATSHMLALVCLYFIPKPKWGSTYVCEKCPLDDTPETYYKSSPGSIWRRQKQAWRKGDLLGDH